MLRMAWRGAEKCLCQSGCSGTCLNAHHAGGMGRIRPSEGGISGSEKAGAMMHALLFIVVIGVVVLAIKVDLAALLGWLRSAA